MQLRGCRRGTDYRAGAYTKAGPLLKYFYWRLSKRHAVAAKTVNNMPVLLPECSANATPAHPAEGVHLDHRHSRNEPSALRGRGVGAQIVVMKGVWDVAFARLECPVARR